VLCLVSLRGGTTILSGNQLYRSCTEILNRTSKPIEKDQKPADSEPTLGL